MIAIPEKRSPLIQPPAESAVNLQLKDVIRLLPKDCFEKNQRKAWTSVAISVIAAGLGYGAIALLPWYLLPLAWVFTGTALTGWFVVGHDCGHRSFAKSRWVNNWVGHIAFAPLIYPFHSWRLLHDHHHLHTNKMHVDNAWHPWTEDLYGQAGPLMQTVYELFRGPLWWMASIIHWAQLHFNPANVSERHRGEVKVSIAVVLLFALIAFPTLVITTGIWGFVKFWLMPWLVYHFWMSTFTLVHHTASDVQFRESADWDAVEAQLEGTIHCDYPRWVEFLCHDINVHVPHHISTGIPSYNLRHAHASLKKTWGDRIKERRFSWTLLKEIIQTCHVYHPETAYRSCAEVRQGLKPQ
ncbi:fatty acid desaturase [Lyngbya confervoides]|uniref:Fatty acid desaturase n=1 Tax=Lyngbya confervoides BDU141951 TaxID=1574623 RepID=A0ABD4T4F7_9CYAN|nr:fatty acid desaturase [Lyngbya confervoides]MCM1983559.1 fatty acid desaturase [Lyngbya confervoides BDU141951]